MFIKKRAIGVDIADHTIEIIEIEKKSKDVEIISKKRVYIGPGIVEKGRVKDEERLVLILKKAFKEAKPTPIEIKEIAFGLPESQLFTHFFKLPPHKDKFREELVRKEAIVNIPLEEEAMVYTHKVLKESKDGVDMLLVAADQKIIHEWQNVFRKLGQNIEKIDIETLAMRRALFAKGLSEPVCLIDLGSATTNIAIFDKEGLRHSYSLNIAGDKFTDVVAKNEKLDSIEAEKKKMTLDLADSKNQSVKEVKVFLDDLVKDIKKTINYCETRDNYQLKKCFLIGGTSKLKGIKDYLKSGLDLEVDHVKNAFLTRNAITQYIVALGYALRHIDNEWEGDPILYTKLKSVTARREIIAPSITKVEAGDEDEQKDETKEIKTAIEESVALTAEKMQLDMKKQLRRQTVTLLLIVVIGSLSIGLAYWYRSYEKQKQEKVIQSKLAQFSKTQTFDFTIQIAVSEDEYKKDRVEGKIIEETIYDEFNLEAAIQKSLTNTQNKLKAGEELWQTPLNQAQLAELSAPPYLIRWLKFKTADVSELLLQKIDKLNKNQEDYLLNEVIYKNIEATDNINLFNLGAEITISLNKLIPNN